METGFMPVLLAHVSRYLADKNYRALKRYLAGSTTHARARARAPADAMFYFG
jgi:hypothetical protein